MLAVLGCFISIQFIPVGHKATLQSDTNKSIDHQLRIPAIELSLLKNACYDCHSDEMRRPWYASIAPVSWMMEQHVSEGKKNLNFSRWTDYTTGIQAKKLDEMIEQLRQGSMPPSNYAFLHPAARLSASQTNALIKYLESQEN